MQMGKTTQRPRRNPVAAAPILRKGGVHLSAKAAQRGKTRLQLRRDVADALYRAEPK